MKHYIAEVILIGILLGSNAVYGQRGGQPQQATPSVKQAETITPKAIINTLQAKPQEGETQKLKVEKETFIYNADGRRDPFLSIVTAVREAEKKRHAGKLVAPIENYDLNQFRIIAIIWNEKEKYATIGLPDGKYYTIREGIKVGINQGKVTKIMPDSIIVIEKIRDYRGDIKPTERVLKLRQEEVK